MTLKSLDGPGFRGIGLLNGIVTDFGWYMDTNNMGINGGNANSPVGTKIINIYNGMVQFYTKVGWSNMVLELLEVLLSRVGVFLEGS